MHKPFVIIYTSLFLCSHAHAGLKEGLIAYQKNDFSTAFEEFHEAAEQGDVRAQNVLGFMYENGQGVGKNEKQAIAWYRIAADQGFSEAQTALGHMYEMGLNGISTDIEQALYWYHKAADQGCARAIGWKQKILQVAVHVTSHASDRDELRAVGDAIKYGRIVVHLFA